jgi:erythromycin esterase
MKTKYLTLVMLFSLFIVNGQNNKTIKWINENTIEIEDASPDSELTVFKLLHNPLIF